MKETDHPWIKVSFDEQQFIVEYEDLEGKNWVQTFQWSTITKICFKSYDYSAPHFLYIFFSDNEMKCIIPIHENGGEAFWAEVKKRKLFDPRNAIVADTSIPEYNCWPDN